MLKILPKQINKKGIYCYDTKLYINNDKIDLTNKWNNLKIKRKTLKINDVVVPTNIAHNFYKFLNRKENDTLCYHFTATMLHTPEKCYKRWINTAQLDTLKLFDKVELFRIVNDIYEKSEHMTFYIGRHFNNTQDEEYLFLSKIGSMGLYVTDIQQLLFLYRAVNTHMRVYRSFDETFDEK